jgi:hypothetical protein
MKSRKFVSYTVIRTSGCYRYLYRNTITTNKDKVIKGKDVDPAKTTEQLAQYFFDIARTNTFFPYANTDPTIFDVVLFKLDELQRKAITRGAKLGLVTYLEIFKDPVEGNKIRLVFSEKILDDRERYGLWGFDENEADNIIYLTIYGGRASTQFETDQFVGGGGALLTT